MSKESPYDFDDNGTIDGKELTIMLKKTTTQRRIAILSGAAMVGITFLIVFGAGFGILTPEIILSFSNFLGWFYTACAGIIATYMGAQAYIDTKITN